VERPARACIDRSFASLTNSGCMAAKDLLSSGASAVEVTQGFLQVLASLACHVDVFALQGSTSFYRVDGDHGSVRRRGRSASRSVCDFFTSLTPSCGRSRSEDTTSLQTVRFRSMTGITHDRDEASFHTCNSSSSIVHCSKGRKPRTANVVGLPGARCPIRRPREDSHRTFRITP